MFKRAVIALVFSLALAAPAAAETTGVYAGIKFIDSIQSTGPFSLSGDVKGLGIGQYSQNSVGGGVFLGYDFYPQFQVPMRAELEYAIRTTITKTWDARGTAGAASFKGEWGLQTLFANAYWDFHNSTAFTPYIGGGLGLGFIKTKYTADVDGDGDSGSLTQHDTVFAWNLGAGCSYAFTENLSADLAYRFVGLGYTDVSKRADDNKVSIGSTPYANEFSLGLRYTF